MLATDSTEQVDYWGVVAAQAEVRRADRAHRLSVACPRPRCPGVVGEGCRTPNGYLTYHAARERLVRGEAPAKVRPHRLTDPQAQRIEWAAEAGVLYAAGQYATLSGDATERQVADALEKHGYIRLDGESDSGERRFVLTELGWRTYWHSRLVIRRLPEEKHESTCPCTTKEN